MNKKVVLPFKFNGMSENHCFAIEYHNVSSSVLSIYTKNHTRFTPPPNRVQSVGAVHTERMTRLLSGTARSEAVCETKDRQESLIATFWGAFVIA